MRPTAMGWLLAIPACLVFGTGAVAATKTNSGNNTLEQALARLGGRGTLVEGFLVRPIRRLAWYAEQLALTAAVRHWVPARGRAAIWIEDHFP